MTIELYTNKKLPGPSRHRGSGDGSPYFAAGPAQQLGGVCLQHLASYLTAEVLAFATRIHQPSTNQLFDVVRDRSLGDGKLLPQLGTGTLTLPGNDLEHCHAPRIRQRLGDQLELFLGQW